MAHAKIRFRFSKVGDLRWTSHHDLMRSFERTMRRAEIPFLSSQGFNPKPKMSFAMPLPLGIEGLDEVVEVDVASEMTSSEALARLQAHSPPGLFFHAAEAIEAKVSARVCSACYQLDVCNESLEHLAQKIADWLALPSCWVERAYPRKKRVEIKQYVSKLRLEGTTLELILRVTNSGTAKPEEVARQLGLDSALCGKEPVRRSSLILKDNSMASSVPACEGSNADDTHELNESSAAFAADALTHALEEEST